MANIFERKKTVALGSATNVSLPKADHELLNELAEYTGKSRAELITKTVAEMLCTQIAKNEDFKDFLEERGKLAQAQAFLAEQTGKPAANGRKA